MPQVAQTTKVLGFQLMSHGCHGLSVYDIWISLLFTACFGTANLRKSLYFRHLQLPSGGAECEYLDRHITPLLAIDLVKQGYDALTTQDAGMNTASDAEQLEFATQGGRAVLTYNIADFALLHEQWMAEGKTHAGIIVSRQLSKRRHGILLDRVLRFLNKIDREEMKNNFVHLEQFK